MNAKLLSLVIPVFNEEETLAFTHERLLALTNAPALPDKFQIVYVNDGSTDRSPVILDGFARDASDRVEVRVIHLTRNFGHSAAVIAGLMDSTGDLIGIIDADLQDPPELLSEMAALIAQGWDVVYGQRTTRRGEPVFKRFTAWSFYRILNLLTGVDIPRDVGDFRLITREVADALLACNDQYPFLRGLVAWVGFEQKAFPYAREPRRHGSTKYPLRKMVGFASEAILSFSSAPLRIATHLGLIGLVSSVAIGVWALWAHLQGRTVSGWTSLLDGMLLGQSFVLLCIGFIGSYTGRIYTHVQRRPRYIVRKRTNWPRR